MSSTMILPAITVSALFGALFWHIVSTERLRCPLCDRRKHEHSCYPADEWQSHHTIAESEKRNSESVVQENASGVPQGT